MFDVYMEIVIYKSYEISDDVWRKITAGFNESFDTSFTYEEMKKGFFVQNPLGYGYHAVAFSDDGDVMGYNVYSPTLYKDGLKIIVSGSTYVRKKYRKYEFLFLDMVSKLKQVCVDDGFVASVGVPNHNSLNYALKINRSTHIADLNYFVLPLSISRILNKNRLSYLDWLTRCCSFLLLYFSQLVSSIFDAKEKTCKYEIDISYPYFEKRFPVGSVYKQYHNNQYQAFYRICVENSANVCYIMDFREGEQRTFKALVKTVNYILKNEKIDAVVFVGFLRMFQTLLFKIPSKFCPKRLPLTFKILDKQYQNKYHDMLDAKKWNFSLMNFDVR